MVLSCPNFLPGGYKNLKKIVFESQYYAREFVKISF